MMDELASAPELIRSGTRCSPDYLFTSRQGTIFGARWNHPQSETALRNNAEHVLVYHLSGNPDVERRVRGRVTGYRSRVGSVTFMPRNSESEWRLGGNTQVIHLYLPDALLQAHAREYLESEECPEIVDFFAVMDPWLDGLFRMLASETPPTALKGVSLETLLLDQMQSLLVQHLLSHYTRKGERQELHGGAKQPAGKLRPSVVKHINQLIAERLSEDICLQDLAEVACMSKNYFLRAFRETVGQTPYNYVMAMRIERARTLLKLEAELPIAEIARRTGFKNLSHFSTAFRKIVSVTPSVYRERF